MENLLSILYATSNGNQKLNVELLNLLLSATVVYDRHKEAWCGMLHYMEMINLEEIHPSIYVKTS